MRFLSLLERVDSDRQTFVIDNIKLVSVKDVVDHKILSTTKSRWREELRSHVAFYVH